MKLMFSSWIFGLACIYNQRRMLGYYKHLGLATTVFETKIEILACFKCVKEINSISCIWIVFWGFDTQCFSNIYRLKNCVAELFLQIGFIIKRHLERFRFDLYIHLTGQLVYQEHYQATTLSTHSHTIVVKNSS